MNPHGVFVTQPDEQAIAQAKEYIQQVMNGEIVKVEDDSNDDVTDQTSTNTTN